MNLRTSSMPPPRRALTVAVGAPISAATAAAETAPPRLASIVGQFQHNERGDAELENAGSMAEMAREIGRVQHQNRRRGLATVAFLPLSTSTCNSFVL